MEARFWLAWVERPSAVGSSWSAAALGCEVQTPENTMANSQQLAASSWTAWFLVSANSWHFEGWQKDVGGV